MSLKLSDIADITQGSILTRIKTDNGTKYDAYTMQQLSYYVNSSDEHGNFNTVDVLYDKIPNICLSQKYDLILGLTSGKAMIVEEDNKLILSNFIRIRINNTNLCNPDFLCWMLNENKDVQKNMKALNQGSTRVGIITPNFIKDLEINLIPIQKQIEIGRIYQLQRKKTRIVKNKIELENSIYKATLNNIYINNKSEENK